MYVFESWLLLLLRYAQTNNLNDKLAQQKPNVIISH